MRQNMTQLPRRPAGVGPPRRGNGVPTVLPHRPADDEVVAAALAIILFLFQWNLFLFPLVVLEQGKYTIPVAINQIVGAQRVFPWHRDRERVAFCGGSPTRCMAGTDEGGYSRKWAALAVLPLLLLGLADVILLLGWGLDPLWGFMILPPILFMSALAWIGFRSGFVGHRTVGDGGQVDDPTVADTDHE